MLPRVRPPGGMLRVNLDNHARAIALIRSNSKFPTTSSYQSMFSRHRLSAAVAFYSTARTPNPATPPATRLPSTRTTTNTTTLSNPLANIIALQSYSLSDTLNPPISTLPPPLNLPPPREPDQSLFSYYLALGKAYLFFYKLGIRCIYYNWKWSRQLRRRIAAAPSPQQPRGNEESLLQSGALSRAEFLMLRRTGEDVSKLPLFVFMFCVFGEFTPLLVIALSGLVPRTLWIPKQVLWAREKAESRRAATYAATTKSESGSKSETAMPTKNEAGRLGKILGVYPAWWDRLPITPSWFIFRRVEERLRLIDLDDCAIEQDGGHGDGVQRLANGEEVILAAEMRGLKVLGRGDKELKAVLAKWLRERKKGRSIKTIVLEGLEWR